MGPEFTVIVLSWSWVLGLHERAIMHESFKALVTICSPTATWSGLFFRVHKYLAFVGAGLEARAKWEGELGQRSWLQQYGFQHWKLFQRGRKKESHVRLAPEQSKAQSPWDTSQGLLAVWLVVASSIPHFGDGVLKKLPQHKILMIQEQMHY